MPSDKDHLAKAQKNIEFLESFIDSYNFNDWAVTVAFYTCVHIAEFLFFKKGDVTYRQIPIRIAHSDDLPVVAAAQNIQPPANFSWTAKVNHVFRSWLLSENFSDIHEHYYFLYNKSRQARYYCYKWDKTDVDLYLKYSIAFIIGWVNKNYAADLKVTNKILKA